MSDTNKRIGIAEVKDHISSLLSKSKELGEEELVLISGDIHKELGLVSRIPMVCDAMMHFYNASNDEILKSSPKGKGSRLIIKYRVNLH